MRRFDSDRGLHIYNSLTKQKELFLPQEDNKVGMYVCGVTVYDNCHVGHARAYVTFDIIRRYLEYRGYSVFYVQNFTDIDDKIIERAKEENRDIKEIAERFTDEYFEHMDKLRIKKASVYPKATQHIKEMITIIQGLLDKGYAYNANGNIFFEVSKFKDYGKLSGRTVTGSPGVTQVEADSGKRSPADFALWKSSKDGEPAWDSPWGPGRPGWHIECSAMSMKYLGKTLDIHGGGQDLIFPHHENEIAQSESYSEQPFVKYWLHNGFVTIEDEKMSKSLGNVFTLKDIFKDHSPENLRFLFLTAHYRSPMDFGIGKLKETKTGLDKIYNLIEKIKLIIDRSSANAFGERQQTEEEKSLIEKIQKAKAEFEAAMDDDFNTPLALGSIFDLVRDTNTFIKNAVDGKEEKVDSAATEVLNRVLIVLGELMELLGLPVVPTDTTDRASQHLTSIMEILTEVRNTARAKKNWEISDKIRSDLDSLGIVLEDHREGTTWKWK
ncbi:MAG: cysteine--tRNA ligase [Deltaproteobacteria bacterium]|nr:MAG: cysteine--tRNA ligase [Deltaproteobacteria bacterium]